MIKLFFLWIVSATDIDTTTMLGSFSTDLWLRVPSLGSISLGYGNPVLSSGLTGSLCNPAGLFDIKDREFMIVGSMGTKGAAGYSPVIPIGEEDACKVPLDISLTTPAGINCTAFGIKIKSIGAVALGFMDGIGFGATVNSIDSLTYTFHDTIPDTLTNAEIPQLPSGTSVPVSWIYKTPVTVSVDADGKASYSERNFFLCLASGFGPLRLGAGVNYKPIRGTMDVNSVASVSAPCSLSCVPIGSTSEWTTNVTGYTIIDEDIASYTASIPVSGNEFSFPLGLQFKLGIINLGTCLTLTPAMDLNVDNGGTNLKYINHSPHIDSIYFNPSDISIDSANKIVSGNVGLVMSEFPDTTKADTLESIYTIPSKVAISFGGALKLGFFTFGASLGVSSGRSLWTNLGFESRLLVSWRLNLGLRTDGYILNGTKDSTYIYIPTAALDAGFSFPLKNATFTLGLRTNPVTLAGAFLGSLNKDEFTMPGLFDAFSPVFGVNLRM